MRTYLELEGKFGAQHQPCTNIFLPDKNSLPRKTPVSQKAEKKKRAKVQVKRRFKVRVITQSMPTNPSLPVNLTLSTDPITTATTQRLEARSAANTAIPVTVYNLIQGKFKGIPYPTKRPQVEEGPSTPVVTIPLWSSNPELQPHRTGRKPHGLILCQLPQTCLKLGHLGQFSNGSSHSF